MSDILQARDLSFHYTDGADVLRGITRSIPEGQFCAVLGHNGSGKSTLAKHFNAILLPSGGTVYVDGMDTRDEEKLLDIRSTAGMVFQNPDNQLVASIVEDDVAFALENMGVPPREIRRRVDEALRAVGMARYARHSAAKLSGGQKQRVAIAGVIAMQPRCIILDEPTAMLDPQGRREVMHVICTLNRERGITVVLITHHMDEAVQADRCIVLSHGQVLLDGAPREIFTRADILRDNGLAPPQTIEILHLLNEREHAGLELGALTVQECADILSGYLEGTA